MNQSIAVDRRHAAEPSRQLRIRFNTGPGRILIQTIAVCLFFAAWEWGARAGIISTFLVGAPSGIWHDALKLALSGDLVRDIWLTFYEAMLGFAFGTIIGSILGLSLWYSAFVARLVEPFIIAINSVPKIAFAPIVILWFGTDLLSKVALAISLTAIVALISAYQAAKDADPDLQALLLTLGANKHQIFYKVVVPSTLPAMIATCRINVGFGMVGAVVGEFISSQAGLGHLIYTASSLYDLNTVWVGLFALMALGFILYFVIDFFERRILPWKQATTQQDLRV